MERAHGRLHHNRMLTFTRCFWHQKVWVTPNYAVIDWNVGEDFIEFADTIHLFFKKKKIRTYLFLEFVLIFLYKKIKAA